MLSEVKTMLAVVQIFDGILVQCGNCWGINKFNPLPQFTSTACPF